MESRRAHLKKLGGLGALWLVGCDRSGAPAPIMAVAQSCPTAHAVPDLTRGPFFVDTIDDPNLRTEMGPPPGGPGGPGGPRGPRRPPPGDHPPGDHPPGDHPPGPPPRGFDGPPPNRKMIDAQIPARSDIRANSRATDATRDTAIQAGVPLALSLVVYDLANGRCVPLAGARVDLWHCNARGVYSDVPAGMNGDVDLTGNDFLRGYQTTDAAGAVAFATIYPGWYMGRTVHVHFKVRVIGAHGEIPTEATSQLFFPEATSDAVFAGHAAYKNSAERTHNSDDDIFAQGQPALVLDPHGSVADGYRATLAIGIVTGKRFGG